MNKIDIALKLEPENQSAVFEKSLIGGMLAMDQEISNEQGPALKRLIDAENKIKPSKQERRGICSVM